MTGGKGAAKALGILHFLMQSMQSMTRFRAALLAAVAAGPAAVVLPAAARAEDEPSNKASQIVVTGRALDETPATPAYDSQVLDRDRLVNTASGRIEDALANIAGFEQFRRSDSRSANPSAQGATLRALGGNATSRTLILLDGVPLADPFFGYIPFSAIDPGRLSEVRVTRGGGSGAFGSGAVAGTIEMTSASAQELGLVSGEALVNQRGETALSATLAPELGAGFAVVSGRWDRGEGFWTTPVDQRVPASVRAKYESWSVGLRGVMRVADDVELQVRGLAYDDSRVLRFAGATSGSSGQDASFRLVGRGEWQFDVLGYLQLRDFSNVVISSSTYRISLNQRKTPSTGLGGKIELRPPVGEHMTLRLGSDIRVTDGDLSEEAFNASTGLETATHRAGGRNSDLGFFADDDIVFGPVTLTAGARADRWTIRDGYYISATPAGVATIDNRFADRDGWSGSFRGGAVLRASSAISLRAAAYSGLRQPTLNELYRPFVVFPITTQANGALKNERLVGYEAGVDLKPTSGLSLSFTAFDNKVKDAIANVTIDASTRQRQNVDAIRARGIESAVQWTLGRFELDGSLAWTHARVEASGAAIGLDGMRPAQTPRIAASATAAWHPRDHATLALTLRHVGAQYEDDLQTDILKAATTLDAFVQWPVAGNVSVVLRAENLTDAEIMTRNQAGSIDLGTPRTVWGGVRVGF